MTSSLASARVSTATLVILTALPSRSPLLLHLLTGLLTADQIASFAFPTAVTPFEALYDLDPDTLPPDIQQILDSAPAP